MRWQTSGVVLKRIETLVDDIYAIFDKDIEIKKEDAEEFGKQMASMLVSRISERKRDATLRLSNVGTPCKRKLWYTINAPQLAEKLDAPTRIKFLMGDIAESLVLFLAKIAGHEVSREQETVNVAGVPGHIDAVVTDVLVDVKSASPYSFGKFKEGLTKATDAFGYLTQLGTYRTGTGSKRSGFLALNKVLGHLHLDLHEDDGTDYEQVVRDAIQVCQRPSPPDRGYSDEPDGKSGNRKLGVGCSYCAFKETCWPGLRTIPYANGPRFLTQVVREPNPRGASD
jgi:hypothetical protein